MTCSTCKTEIVELPSYCLTYNSTAWNFCSRVCLVEYVAPELKRACVPKQWLPNEDENERMSQ